MAHHLRETETETGTGAGAEREPGAVSAPTPTPTGRFAVPEVDPLRLAELATPTPWAPRPDLRGSREKFNAGLRGLKHAIRGDSSYFAHAYRGTLIALTAALLSVDPLGWCLLVISGSLVLLSELTHSAVDTLARASGDPDDPPLLMAREIAAAGVLVAAFASGGLTVTVLLVKFGEMFGWW